jgi:hypothetical protein
MRARAGARSFGAMTARSIPAIALVALGATAGPAQAAGFVYGGTTHDGDAIVITAPKGAQKLTGAVVAWHATCDDQSTFSDAERLTPVKPVVGTPLGPGDLLATRNAKGRFRGSEAFGEQNDTNTAMISMTITGRLGRTVASGTLSATVKITDNTTGAAVGSCQTGTLKWAAVHAPRTVYGGSTARNAPVVVHVAPNPRRVHDIMIGWDTQSCSDGSYHVYPDGFQNFPLSRTGAFGNPFTYTATFDDGTKRAFSYDLRGRVTKTSARGTLHVTTADTDATGAPGATCDSGTIAWKALTG